MASETGRPRDPDVDRRIVAAARSILRDAGLDALTVSGVAAAAGVGRPTVYRRFAAPTEIAMAVLYEDIEALVPEATSARDGQAPVLEQLLAVSDPFLTYYARNPGLSAALLELAFFGEGPWRERLEGQAAAWVTQLAADLAGATTDGRLEPDVDVRTLLEAYFALYLSVAVGGARQLFDLDGQRALLRRLLEQHLRGLVPRSGR
ncbi:MAG: TetR/AcrR family transcriptional regulator [Myxococcota bacterium]